MWFLDIFGEVKIVIKVLRSDSLWLEDEEYDLRVLPRDVREVNWTQSSVKFSELFLGLRFTSPKNWITHLFGIKAPRKRIYDGTEYHSDSFVHVRWVGRIIIFFGWWGNNRILQQVTSTNKQLNKFIPYGPERTLTNYLPIHAKRNAQKRCQCLNANIAKLY